MKRKACLFFAFVLFLFQNFLSAQQEISVKATATGQTTGHIAELALSNNSGKTINYPVGPFFIPSSGQYQPYIVSGGTLVPVPPMGTVTVPLKGYCADIFSAPVPAGIDLPPFDTWIKPKSGQLPSYGWVSVPGLGIGKASGVEPTILIPGTKNPLGVTLDIFKRPDLAGPLLIELLAHNETTFDSLKNIGKITTPFSNNPAKEKESVIQQTTWIYTTALAGKVYEKESFREKMLTQLVATSGKPESDLPAATQIKFEKGVDDLWTSFNLVGALAGNFKHTPKAPPRILYPLNGAVLTEATPLFRWLYTGHAPGVLYTLKIVKILPGQSPETALSANPPVFQQHGIPNQFFSPPLGDTLGPCPEYGVLVSVDGTALTSQAESFYLQQSVAPSITGESPGSICEGSVTTALNTTTVTFSWEARGPFTTFTIVPCSNPCGTFTPSKTSLPVPRPEGGKITYSGPQGNHGNTQGSAVPANIANAIANYGQGIGTVYYVSDPVPGIPGADPCEIHTFSTSIDFSGAIQPGSAFSWYVVGETTSGTTVASPPLCDRYSPTTTTGEVPVNTPCPVGPICQIKLDPLVPPLMDGGLKAFTKGSIARDSFIYLESEGLDFDELKLSCENLQDCPDLGSVEYIELSGRVKFEWEITSKEGEFKNLGCLPTNLKKTEGEHVILEPPYIPLPDKDAKPNTVTVNITLRIIDDNPNGAIDKTVPRDFTVEISRAFSTPELYTVKVSPSGGYTLPSPLNTPSDIKICKPEPHPWDKKPPIPKPTIILPNVEDKEKMVVGQWIILEAKDDRDYDLLQNLKCVSPHCTNTTEPDRTYQDDMEWTWKIKSGGGKFIGSAKGRFVIYEAPLRLNEKIAKQDIEIEVKVRNPFGTQIIDNPDSNTITLTVYQAGIKLSFPDSKWLPRADTNSVELTSTLQYCTDIKVTGKGKTEQVTKTWAPAPAHACRIHFFELDSVSQEPGICLNAPIKTEAENCPDLILKNEEKSETEGFNPAKASKCDNNKDLYQSARSKKNVRECKIKVFSLDFGAYGDAASYANQLHRTLAGLKNQEPYYESIPVQIADAPTHPDKRPKIRVDWDNRVTVPVDIDENHIPDNGWTATISEGVLPDPVLDTMDNDTHPVGDGTNGDGFSNYEEYRGFMIYDPKDKKSKHIRLDNNNKDLFIYNPDGFDLSLYRSASKVTAHEIVKTQFTGIEERWVNFNHHTAHGDDQRGIHLHDVNLVKGLMGIAIANFNWVSNSLVWQIPAPPNYNKEVKVDRAGIVEVVNDMNKFLVDSIRLCNDAIIKINPRLKTVTDGLDKAIADLAKWEDALKAEPDPKKKKQIQIKVDAANTEKTAWETRKTALENNKKDLEAKIKELEGRKIDPDEKERWVVAHELSHANNVYHHGEMEGKNPNNIPGTRSGDVQCVMRYDNVGVPVPNFRPEAIGSSLCSAAAGTGYNANGAHFGNCATTTGGPRGDCFHQIRIKCKYIHNRNSGFPIRMDH